MLQCLIARQSFTRVDDQTLADEINKVQYLASLVSPHIREKVEHFVFERLRRLVAHINNRGHCAARDWVVMRIEKLERITIVKIHVRASRHFFGQGPQQLHVQLELF